MRVALLADMHGNLHALDAVLAELAHEPIDTIVCLGDVVESGPRPREVLMRLRDLGCPVVLGNTDERMMTDRRDEARGPDLPPAYAQELWCADQLDDADRAFLCGFRPTVRLALDTATTLLCCHGSPRSTTERIAATTPDAALAAMLADVTATVLAAGHTHTPLLRRWGSTLLVNPGSVGLPFQAGLPAGVPYRPPWAEYAVLSAEGGRLAIDLRRTPLDVAHMRHDAVASGMPFPKQWAEVWQG